MDSIDHVRFQRFLRKECADKDLADRAYTLVQPIMAIAQSGEYPLSPEGTVEPERLAEIIAKATRAVCDEVIPISSNRPIREDWTQDDDYVTNFADCVFHNRREMLVGVIGEDVKSQIVVQMHLAFLDQLLVAFFETHTHISFLMEEQCFRALWSTPALAVFYLCAYAIAGDKENFEEIAALVEILPHAIPIGETWGELEKWLVLVK